jgi:signal transduction histidine kinase
MLLILLDNAIKYGRPGEEGWILLRMDRQNGNASIQVIDNGPGVSPQDLPHLFDRFYRGQNAPTGKNAANANKTPIAGTGLGLAIAQAIARAHHGNITAQSEPSKQTIFTITLPCEQ